MLVKKYIFILLLLVCFIATSWAQKNKYTPIYVKANSIPDSLTYSTEKLAKYFNDNFTTNTDKVRAIYYWIAAHISYDVDNMFAVNLEANKTELIKKTLATQKGICIDYAYLFEDIATRCGVPCISIFGFTKQSGFVDYIAHAWVTAKPDSTWLLYDPTWGSGNIVNRKFVKSINDFYFETKPTEFIKNHMPYDPLWQLLNYPITQDEFFNADLKQNKSKPYFNFTDTISQYQKLSDIDKDVTALRRIENNGIKNTITFSRVVYLKTEIANFQNNQTVNLYNGAAANYNDAGVLFNQYINYKNSQFTPQKPDAQILKMIDTTAKMLNTSQNKLLEIKTPVQNVSSSIITLQKMLTELKGRLDEETKFVNTYVGTPKNKRKALFYKKTYSLFGMELK
ncbi:MAG TPA: transglutaminase domain-containing protein [Bacteroidia bacterium]|nr:transglutaminase domain-containing protein [Bacteroidia bacterium]